MEYLRGPIGAKDGKGRKHPKVFHVLRSCVRRAQIGVSAQLQTNSKVGELAGMVRSIPRGYFSQMPVTVPMPLPPARTLTHPTPSTLSQIEESTADILLGLRGSSAVKPIKKRRSNASDFSKQQKFTRFWVQETSRFAERHEIDSSAAPGARFGPPTIAGRQPPYAMNHGPISYAESVVPRPHAPSNQLISAPQSRQLIPHIIPGPQNPYRLQNQLQAAGQRLK